MKIVGSELLELQGERVRYSIFFLLDLLVIYLLGRLFEKLILRDIFFCVENWGEKISDYNFKGKENELEFIKF